MKGTPEKFHSSLQPTSYHDISGFNSCVRVLDRPGREGVVEISEAEKELDYKPTTSLQDGINKFIAWYLGSSLDEAAADDDENDDHVIYLCFRCIPGGDKA